MSGESSYSICVEIDMPTKGSRGEPYDYLPQFTGELRQEVGEDEGGCYSVIGTFSGYLLHHIAESDAYEMFDSIDQDAYEYWEALVDPKTKEWLEVMGDEEDTLFGTAGNALIVDRIVVNKEHRGNGLGLIILDHLISLYGELENVVLIRPAPIDEPLNEESHKRDVKWLEGREKISRYWQRLGFKKHREDFMFLDTAYKRPSLEEALKGIK